MDTDRFKISTRVAIDLIKTREIPRRSARNPKKRNINKEEEAFTNDRNQLLKRNPISS